MDVIRLLFNIRRSKNKQNKTKLVMKTCVPILKLKKKLPPLGSSGVGRKKMKTLNQNRLNFF